MAFSSVMASKTLLVQNPNLKSFSSHHKGIRLNQVSCISNITYPKIVLHKPKLPYNRLPLPIALPIRRIRVSASSTSSPTVPTTNSSKTSDTLPSNLLTGSTRSITTILVIAISISKLLANVIQGVSFKLKEVCLNPTVGTLFFASLRDRPSGYLNTPLTVVASGMAKWLDIYSGVLMVRVLLSWFPNIPWDRQPLSAIRDLCDPYLNLFRNIIPPIFDTLDVSPLLAFAVLGTLGSILNNSRGTY